MRDRVDEERDQRDEDEPALEPDGRGDQDDGGREKQGPDVANEMLVVGRKRFDPAAAGGEVLVERSRGQERIEAVDDLNRREQTQHEPGGGSRVPSRPSGRGF